MKSKLPIIILCTHTQTTTIRKFKNGWISEKIKDKVCFDWVFNFC